MTTGGKFVCCSTTGGIRVFATDALLGSREGDVAPLFVVQPTMVEIEYGSMPSYYYGLVDDPDRHRIIFGGGDGTIRALDLNSGETTDLLEIPGKPAIMQMQLAGRLLFCYCQPGYPETRGKPKPPLLQVWNLDALISPSGID